MHVHLPNTTEERDILRKVESLNEDPSIHGIIVQMPLDTVTEVNESLVESAVAPEKDVDGYVTRCTFYFVQ